MAKSNETIISGQVTEALPNTMFRVIFPEGTEAPGLKNGAHGLEMIAYLSGKMKLHRIKVLVGDTVDIVIDPYGGRGRIVKRK